MRAILLGACARVDSQFKKLVKDLKIREKDLLIGVDGGTAIWVKLGFQPDIALGDWDSLKDKKILDSVPHVTLPRDKDRSDLFFALSEAVRSGARELVCMGVTGGRPDHHLAALLDLAEFSADVESLTAIATDARTYFVSGKPTGSGLSLKLKKGQTISVFSLPTKAGKHAAGVRFEGLKFQVPNGTLNGSQGLSNVAARPHCKIGLTSGTLVVIVPC